MDGDEEGQDNSGESTQGNEDSTGKNPAWDEFLSVVPEELHSQVTPLLSKWDKGVQQKISQVHSQYEPYKPYVDGKVDPNQIDYAMQVLQAIETNPKEVMAALTQWMGEEDTTGSNEQQGQNDSQQLPEQSDFLKNPEYLKLNDTVQTMAKLLVQQRDDTQQAESDRELNSEFESLHKTHGDFDEEWVLTKLLNDDKLSVKDAVEAYDKFVTKVRSEQRRPGPKVIGAGGSIPGQEIDVKKLDSKGTRGLVQQMLQQAAEQNQ